METTIIHDGAPATRSTLERVAFAGFAHFTAMQLRDGAVRGLERHHERLRRASTVMFGTALSDDVVLEHLRRAVARDLRDASLTFFVASAPGEFEAPSSTPSLETFVRVSPPATPPAGPLRLDAVEHVRDLPQVKHVGEVGKTLHLRRARLRGFDDALFVDTVGHVSEATIWNVAFWDGSGIVWPRAAMLDGVTQQLLRARLATMGVPQRSLPVRVDAIDPRWSAAVMNSWSPGIAVSHIGSTALAPPTTLLTTLHRAFASIAPQTVHDA